MKRDLERIARETWDVIVVGGGIYGVCAAREAALRGLRACVLERGDFGGATSSRSLKILHGGIRYLQHLDLVRMRQSILERRRMLRIAPHLVRPLACLLPTRGHGMRGRAVMSAALAIHDVVGIDRNSGLAAGQKLPRGTVISLDELLRRVPGLPVEGVSGASLWYDAQAWSTERLLIAFLVSGVDAGAQAANHVRVERLLERNRRVEGVLATDLLNGRSVEIRGSLVLNAAGPWIDELLAGVGGTAPRTRFHTSKAFNLVIRRNLSDHAIGIVGSAPFRDEDAVVDKGGRVLFLVPWRGHTLVGTKHLSFHGPPDACSISRDEVEQLIEEVNAGYPTACLTFDDVVAVHAGVLPEKRESGTGEVQLAKHPILVDHAREDGIEGLVTMAGVKWTTARLVASHAMDRIVMKLGRGASRSVSQDVPVAGGDIPDFDRFLDELKRRCPPGVPAESIEPLARSYGTRASLLLDRVRTEPELGQPVHAGSPVLAVQVVHAAEAEMGLHLDDVMVRRTELWLGAQDPEALARRCAELVASRLGWDGERRRIETDRGLAGIARPRSLA